MAYERRDATLAEAFAAAAGYGLRQGEVVVSMHCGSRGLGHEVGTDYLRDMALQVPSFGIRLPDRELARAPIHSDRGQRCLGAMRTAMNCALANRQILTHLCRESFRRKPPTAQPRVLYYDVSRNICKVEVRLVQGESRSWSTS